MLPKIQIFTPCFLLYIGPLVWVVACLVTGRQVCCFNIKMSSSICYPTQCTLSFFEFEANIHVLNVHNNIGCCTLLFVLIYCVHSDLFSCWTYVVHLEVESGFYLVKCCTRLGGVPLQFHFPLVILTCYLPCRRFFLQFHGSSGFGEAHNPTLLARAAFSQLASSVR